MSEEGLSQLAKDVLGLMSMNDRWLGGTEAAALLDGGPSLHCVRLALNELVRLGLIYRRHTVASGAKTVIYRITDRGRLLAAVCHKLKGALG